MIGYALCGSFCTHEKSVKALERLIKSGADVLPIMSECVYQTDTKFGTALDLKQKVSELCGKEIIHTIVDAEPLGPRIHLDALIISPCTGNTLAKIANGITDTAVCMAAKAHLRGNRPLIIALASNDAMSANLKNIASLLSKKNVYFNPMYQDDIQNKPHSLVANFDLIEETLELALMGKQNPKIFR
jgi:dipicolinate synthase subunit B